MTAFQNPTQVRFIDIDSFGHVNNAVYFYFFENAREHFYVQPARDRLDPASPAYATVSPTDTFADLIGPTTHFMLVSHQEIEYLQQLPYRMEPIVVDLWVARIGRSSLDFGYTLREEDGSVIYAKANSGIVKVSRSTGRPDALTDAEREFLESWSGDPVVFRNA